MLTEAGKNVSGVWTVWLAPQVSRGPIALRSWNCFCLGRYNHVVNLPHFEKLFEFNIFFSGKMCSQIFKWFYHWEVDHILLYNPTHDNANKFN